MTTLSKLIPPEAAHLSCYDLIHPWNPSCWGNVFNMVRITWMGSFIFYTVHLLFQFLHKMAKDRKTTLEEFDRGAFLKQLLINYFRMVILFATPLSAGTLAVVCFLRKLLGRFYSKTYFFIPSCIGALGVFALDPKIRLLASTFFTNFALTVITRKLQLEGIFNLTLFQKTLAFIFLSGAISGIVRKLSEEGKANLYYWFFNPIPLKPKPEEAQCCHDNSCRKFILTDFVKYFTSGVLLSSVKIIFKHGHRVFTNPRMLFSQFLTGAFWRLPAFLGLYSFTFQGLRCTLRQVTGKTTVFDNVLAGAVAGINYHLHPSMTLMNTGLITLVQVLSLLGSQSGFIPNLPYTELFFAVSTGILFETTILTPKLVPNMALYIFRTATSGRATEHHRNILGKFKDLGNYSDLAKAI